jgi:Reprolysin family propeptide./Reprolysin (M12B) family zinc metalloprotease./FG-GAP repeat.
MKTAFNVAKQVSVFSVVLFLATTAFGQADEAYRSHFSRFDVVRAGASSIAFTDSRRMTIVAQGRAYDLIVQEHDLRAPHYRSEDTGPMGKRDLGRTPTVTFKGRIEGITKSEVRLSIDGDLVEGFFDTESERFFIEPAKRYSPNASTDELIVYRSEDILHREDFWCSSEMPTRIESGKRMAESNTPETIQSVKRLDMATEADNQFVGLNGGATATNNEILAILNMAEGTFSSEISVTIRVVYQHTWSTADPFSGANTEQLLTSFRNYWNANQSGVSRNAAHLFTGKSYAQSQGYAYFSVICTNPGAAYGLSGHVGWAPGKYLVTAHEIGHNLGANHADAPQGCSNSVMNTQLSGTTPLTFCNFSRSEIGGFVAGNGSCMLTVSTGRTAFDFDGDGQADIGVFRPGNGVWYLNRSGSGFSAFQFGQQGDRAVAGDYDGDGKSDAAIYRNGSWWRIKSATNTIDVVPFGLAGDIPAPADFDGDGKTDVAVFRPANGVWYRSNSSNGAFAATAFGLAGDVPSASDYDGDAKADITVFRPSTGIWYRLNSSNGAFSAVQFGLTGDLPVILDQDGDARTDIAVWRPSNGVWYSLRSSDNGFRATAFGLAADIPTPADYDGDGRTDIAVYRPSTGVWYRLNSSNGSFAAIPFGLNGDAPVQSYYVQ